jgi:hypothetical protein
MPARSPRRVPLATRVCHGPLAGLDGVPSVAGFEAGSGAEWSLAWPGKGIAVDSCVFVMVVLTRPAAGSSLMSLAGVNTVSAAGTDWSVLLVATAALSTTGVAVVDTGGMDAGRDAGTDGESVHAPSDNAAMQTEVMKSFKRINFLSVKSSFRGVGSVRLSLSSF